MYMHSTYMCVEVPVGVNVNGQRKLQFAQQATGGRDRVDCATHHVRVWVEGPQAPREHNFWRGDGGRGENIPRF